jgi:hypothetical protein
MSGGSDSANETWKPWPGWKFEPAACVLRTTTRIATGSRGEFRWLRAPVTRSARQSRSLASFLLSVSGRTKAMSAKLAKMQRLQMAVAAVPKRTSLYDWYAILADQRNQLRNVACLPVLARRFQAICGRTQDLDSIAPAGVKLIRAVLSGRLDSSVSR